MGTIKGRNGMDLIEAEGIKKRWQEYTEFSLVTQWCLALCNPIGCSMPGFTVHHQLPECAQTHVHQVGDAIQWSYPLSSLSSPASIFPSIRVFSNESAHQVAKVLEFWLQHQPFQWIFSSDFFRIDWFDILAVQGNLKSPLQHNSSKASIIWCSAFFMVQFSLPYMTTEKP